MRKKIFHNWALKLGSLVLAFLLWLLVIQFDDPKETQTFRGIPVTLTNTQLLDQQDKVYEVLENTDTVTVTVRAPRSIIDGLSASDISAVADMSKLTEINTIAITFSVQNVDDVENIKGNPDVLKLNVEDRKTKWINVQYSTTGEVAEGYMVASTQLDQTRIEITGPQSAVDKVSYASVDMDVSGVSSSLSANVEIQLHDANDNLIQLGSITKNVNYIRMAVEVLATKEVPIVASMQGTPADGYLTTGEISCEPSMVMIAGTASALANVNRISIPADQLDITGATANVVETVNIRNLLSDSNVRLADSSFNGNVDVTVHVEPIVERTLELLPDNIAIRNIPEGISVLREEGEGPYQLTLSGLGSAVNAVRAETLGAGVDLTAWMREQGLERLTPGVYHIPVTFSLPANVSAGNTVTLQITISEMEDS